MCLLFSFVQNQGLEWLDPLWLDRGSRREASTGSEGLEEWELSVGWWKEDTMEDCPATLTPAMAYLKLKESSERQKNPKT